MTIRKLLALACFTVGLSAQAAVAGAQDGPFIFVSGPLSDPYFSAVKAGADTAAKELGITDYQYTTVPSYEDIVPLYTRLTEAAIARQPAALILGNFFPDAIEPLIKKAADAGVAVVVHGSGRDTWRGLGAIGYVGEDSYLMGKFGGEAAAKAGVKNGVCVNNVAANPTLEQRCKGYIDAITAAGGTAKMIEMAYEDTANAQKQQQAIAAVLMADKDVNGIFTLNAAVAVSAIEAKKQAGREVIVGTTDLSTAAVEAIKAGDLLFAIDQQPFLQGYYGMLIAYQYKKYGLKPATEINSGPLVVDAKGVEAVLAANAAYPGVRGAN